jgi:uncharacterized protein YdhG (YjbR/CyaY superfamily)
MTNRLEPLRPIFKKTAKLNEQLVPIIPVFAIIIPMPLKDRKSAKQEDDTAAVLAAIDAMPEPDKIIGKRLHSIIMANAPGIMPRTWYGMPAYSNGNKIICYFRSTKKFGERYMTFGFNDAAKLDEGSLWPIVYALTEMTPENEAELSKLVKKAVG